MTGRAPRPDAGLTLIELVIAMAILAMVSIMGLQGITGMLQTRDRLDARVDATQELARATALLRADLAAVVPLVFVPPEGGTPQSAVHTTDRALALSVAGQPDLNTNPAPGFGRVVWHVDAESGDLVRQVWARLTPADGRATAPEVTIMADVRALSVRSYLGPSEGWVSGAPTIAPETPQSLTGAPIAAPAPWQSALPRAVSVTLDTRAFGEITVIETLQ